MAQADGSIIIDAKINTDGVDDAQRQFKKAFNKVSDSAEDMGDTVNDAASDAAKGLKQAGEAAEDYAKDVNRAADKSDGAFKKMFSAAALSEIAVDALKAAGEAIKDFVVGSVEAAADVKASNSQFSETFKDLERTSTKSLKQIEKKTGTAASRMQSYYTKLFAYSKTIGAESAEALDLSNRAMLAAADSAAYYDKSLEEVVETLQSYLKGNYENDAALGIASTETTRNAMANKLYAKSFIELSEAQKVDVLLAMVEAGNQASGALGQAARESDSWTNATGELNEAMRQLQAVIGNPIMEGFTDVIQGITKSIYNMIEATAADKLNEGIKEFEKGLEAADKALADSTKSMAATSRMAQRYVDRLRSLESAGLDTAEAQREYAQVVELLNSLMPELGLTINEVTGRLDQNTSAIEQNIMSLQQQAEQQAKMAYYKTIIDEYAEAYEAQYAAEIRLIELQEQELLLNEQLTVANQEYSATLNQGTAAQERELKYLNEIRNELAVNQREQAELTKSIDASTAALNEHQTKLDRATEGYAELTEASGEVTTATDVQSEALSELSEAYEEAEGKARESIDSQIGYFSELKKTSSDSAGKIIQNWDGQKEAFDRYASNLEKAVDMGLDEALVQQLSDGSTESMAILDEFVNGTDTSVDDINAAWQRMNESRQTVAQAMAAIETEVDDKLEDIVDDAKAAGPDTVKALANGIEGNTGYVTRAMRELAQAAIAEYNRTISNGKYKTPSGAAKNAKDVGISPYSVSPVVAQTATAEPTAQLMSTMTAVSPKIPVLAVDTIIPPQATAQAASTFAKAGGATGSRNDLAQMLATGEDIVQSNVAGHEAMVKALYELIATVQSIELDGETLTKAVENYQRKRAVSRGW